MALIFGMSYLFINEALKFYTTFELLAYRFILAAAIMTGLAALKIIKVNYRGKPVRLLVLLSFFQPCFYFICETMGVKYASVSEVGIFVAFIPVFATILAFFILKERPYGKQAVFILISVSGAVFDVVMSGSFEYKGSIVGILFLVGLVLASGGYNITTRKSSESFTAIEITFFMICFGAVFFTVARLIEMIGTGAGRSFMMLFTIRGAVPILYLGALSSIFGFFLLNYILARLSVASAAVFVQLASVAAILSGILIVGDALYWFQIVSGALILIGVFGTNYYESKIAHRNAIVHN